MIDFHSHILPRIDDGSRSVEESLTLLEMLTEQGIDTVVATPHFQANKQPAGDFLERRNSAYESVKPYLTDKHPDIILGAEVEYYNGISKISKLIELCGGRKHLLLLEMPQQKWTEYTVKELAELSGSGDLAVAVAHVERYIEFQSDESLRLLYGCGIRMQFNASYFLGFFKKRKALSMLKNGRIHMLGSDCHGVKYRPPQIGSAYDIIRTNLGEDFLRRFDGYGRALLGI